MRHSFSPKFLFGITLLALTSALLPAFGDEPPSVQAYPNSPGWITVMWEHPGTDVYWFDVYRQNPDKSTQFVVRSYNRTDNHTDKGLQPDTLYKYSVCAVYAYSQSCSDWVSAKTMPPPPPPPSNGTVQNAPQTPKHQLRTPNLTATSNAPNFITLHWGSDSSDLYTLGNVQLYRDGRITYDSKKYGGFTADYNDGGRMYDSTTKQWTGQPLRPNTEYTYKVCFIGFNEAEGQIICSREIVAMGQPIAPTVPANVAISKSRIPVPTRGPGRLAAAVALRTVIFANWRSPDPTKGEIPGQFITVERLDRVITGNRNRIAASMFANAWIEIDRIKAKGDPTSLSVDITPSGLPNPTDTPGNSYRLCAVVPALGAGGKVCSAPATLP